jgi:ankyrin repeat protein
MQILLKKIIEHGGDVNLKSYNGTSPLVEAYQFKQYEIIKILLENNALDIEDGQRL